MGKDNLDLILSGNLDSPIPLKEANTIFSKIDRIMDKAIAEQNGWVAINAVQELYEVARLSSISLAKFLYEIVTNWEKFNINEDVYAVLNDKLGIHHYTVVRYAEAWNTLPSIPEEHREKIIGRGISDLLKVTKMLNSGYEPDKDQWGKIANASDRMAFQDEIREVTHEEPGERAITISMEINGDVWAYHMGEKHSVGKLNTASGEYAVQKAIYRMTIGGGVSRK